MPSFRTKESGKDAALRVRIGTIQLIAANIDTAFIVSSCNQDFNVARLERYIALAFEAEITPVIVLTKADSDPYRTHRLYVDEARAISELVSVVDS